MKWQLVKLKYYNGYELKNEKAYSKAKKFYKYRYPSEKTTENLKKMGIKEIIYQNGDSIEL